MIGNEINRISPLGGISNPTLNKGSEGSNILPLIAIFATVLVLGSIVLIHTQRKIEEHKKHY